jgi:alkanesulfonate monooxygenase SsuD/methylene tetrahydromethanopterin reductase-like flavin-dependent oxidoreductase (luciferase family)
MSPSIEFSLTLPRFEDPGERDPFRRTYEFARHVESVGFAGGFVGHHSFTPETKDPSAPFVLLAAIAARTERLRLGTGVFLGALHHPITICEQVATLDQISGGRAVLGLGTGYRPYEFEAYGSPFGQRGRRLNETIEILRSTWASSSSSVTCRSIHRASNSRTRRSTSGARRRPPSNAPPVSATPGSPCRWRR